MPVGKEAGPLGRGPTAQEWLQSTAMARLAVLWREHSKAMDNVAIGFAQRAFALHTSFLGSLAEHPQEALAGVLRSAQEFALQVRAQSLLH